MRYIIIGMVMPIFFLTSCTKYVQLIQTTAKSPKINEQDSFYVYEDDSLKITYNFWQERGVMAFSIYNKLSIPIYIDWKKSSFIDKSIKLDYFLDKEIKTSEAIFANYQYKGPRNIFFLFDLSNVGVVSGKEVSQREERVTFIPPRASFSTVKYILLPDIIFKVTSSYKIRIENRNDNPSKTTKVYYDETKGDNAKNVFRNFLTYSTTEDFKAESYIDNEFFISGASVMDVRHFRGKLISSSSPEWIYEYPFSDPKRFYILKDIPKPYIKP